MPSHLGKLNRLIEDFNEAALRPDLWQQALHKTAQVFGSDGACLLAWPGTPTGAIWSEGLDCLMEPYFAEGWYAHNARLARAVPLRGTKAVLTEADLFTRKELDALPFNAEFVNPQGFRWVAGAFVASVDGAHTALALERKTQREPFSSREQEAIAAFLPHMRRAAEVAIRFTLAHGDGMLDAFEKIGCAALVIDYLGKVKRFNQHTERHIGSGSALQIVQGQLTAAHKESDNALQRLVADLLRPPEVGRLPQVLAVIQRPEHRPLFVYGMPVARSAKDVFQYCSALLILVDPDEHMHPSALILRQGFKLTQAEIRLAIALAQGTKLDEYAEKHDVSIGTVRIQLKSVMAKTSTHRQAELVSFLGQLSQAVPAKE